MIPGRRSTGAGGRGLKILAFAATLTAAACQAGVSVRLAEEQCAERARLADGIGGSVRAGVGSGGVRGGATITITDDIFRTNPESADIVYENCVIQKTGQGPTRPLGLVG